MSIEKKTFAERFHRSTRHLDAEPCRNCDTEYVGNYCPNCGQEAHTGAPTALAFIYEFLTRNVFERGKLPRTIWHLVRYPGGLTIDFLEGRRQRFIRPVRLYIGLSVLYFLILSFLSGDFSDRMTVRDEPAQAQAGSTAGQHAKEKEALERALKQMDAENAPPAARALVRSRLDALASAPPPAPGPAATPAEPLRFSSKLPLLDKERNASSAPGASVPPANAAQPVAQAKASASADKAGGEDEGEDESSEPGRRDFDLQVDFLDKLPDTGASGVLKKRIKRFTSLPKAERGPALLQGMLNQAPKAMFFLVPVFAMLLKLLFVLRRIPYGAHLLFAFHYHSLVFLGLLLMFLPLPEVAMALLPVAMWLYLALALRNTYMCSWFGAVVRLMALSLLYPLAISLAMVGAGLAAVLL